MRVKLWIVLFLMLGLLAGCARATPTPAPTPVAPAPPTPVARITPTPTPPPTALVPTGELRIALGYLGVEVMDPTLGPATGSKGTLWPLFDYLVGGTPQGQFSKETGLARDWEVSHGPTSSKYTFLLRQGVKFHNGEEVTAEDVKFSLEYFMRPASVATYAGGLRAAIDRIETPERYKVVVHTKQPYGLLVLDLSRIGFAEGMVLPKKYLEQAGAANFNISPIGSGPYRLKEQVVGSYMRFEAVENHWLVGVPKYKTITLFLVPEETTRIAMLKTGQADLIEISRELAKKVTDPFKTFLKPGSEIVVMWLGNQWQADTYLYDKRVREALNLAINREDILKFLFEGQGEVTGSPYAYGSASWNYKPLPLYPYDPERAKALLKEAFPGGVSLTIDSYARPGVPELQKTNEAIAGMWEKVGVKTKIVSMEYGTHRAKQAKGGIPNVASSHSGPIRPMGVSVWRVLNHSTGLLAMTKSPDLDALIEAAEAEVDLTKAAQREWEVARFIRENHMGVPLLEVGLIFAGNPKKIVQWDLGKMQSDHNFLALITQR